MKYIEKVQGSAEQAVPLIINHDIVYIHKNITKLEREDNAELYEYEEYQYSKDEYLQVLTQENQEMMLAIAELGNVVAGDNNG